MKKYILAVIILLIACNEDDGQPIIPEANFKISANSVQEGSTIQFTNTSENATDFSWRFPGGNPTSSSLEHPEVNYSEPGIFAVTLIATNDNTNDTLTKENIIEVTRIPIPPTALFETDTTFITENQTISFTNLSEHAEAYLWSFPGGSPQQSTEPDPTVTYPNEGTFPVTLYVANGDGEDTLVREDYITVSRIPVPPVAAFEADRTTIEEGQSVAFNSTSQNAEEYLWSFPGGSPQQSTEPDPTVTYPNEGTFAVTLYVANGDGEDTLVRENYIQVTAVPLQTATYTLTYTGNWSETNHPVEFPTTFDHFSNAVGMVHNSNIQLFEVGQIASQGIEDMAERGDNNALDQEVNGLIPTGNVLAFFNSGFGLGTGLSQINHLQITVTSEFPLVSIVSMIAPSPDWFVSSRNIELFKNGAFIDQITVAANSYDAGSDSGVTFLSADSESSEPITRITTAPLGNGSTVDPPMAYFTLTRN